MPALPTLTLLPLPLAITSRMPTLCTVWLSDLADKLAQGEVVCIFVAGARASRWPARFGRGRGLAGGRPAQGAGQQGGPTGPATLGARCAGVARDPAQHQIDGSRVRLAAGGFQ